MAGCKQIRIRRGFTLIQLMLVLCLIGILMAFLLPEIQKNNDDGMHVKHKEGAYWVYSEYEYAGGPVTSEMSGSCKHTLQEILDMHEMSLKKQQEQYRQELLAEKNLSVSLPVSPYPIPEIKSEITDPVNEHDALDNFWPVEYTREEKINKIKRAIKNHKFTLSQNEASLIARRNIKEAIHLLEKKLKRLESTP